MDDRRVEGIRLSHVVSQSVDDFSSAEGRLETVRYHEEFYAQHDLFVAGSWLHRPAPFVMRGLEHLSPTADRALDLGAGVGRHTIPIAQRLGLGSLVVGVDLLPIAGRRLHENATELGVRDRVQAIVADLEHLALRPASLDLLVSVSAMEHVSGPTAFVTVLRSCQRATRVGGLHCLIIGTDKVEEDAAGVIRPARVEYTLTSEDGERLLREVYAEWETLDYSRATFSVDEDRDGESYALRTTNLRLLVRRTAT